MDKEKQRKFWARPVFKERKRRISYAYQALEIMSLRAFLLAISNDSY